MDALAINGGPASVSFVPSWPRFGEADEQAVLDVVRSGHWGSTSGTTVAQFESELAASFGAEHAIALTSGTTGLVAALASAGVGIGDEVIVPPYTFIATVSAALFLGAIPVFADVRGDNHLIDPESIRSVITERTRAIVVVHLAGGIADMDAINAIAQERGLRVIEDCAQAAGASWNGRSVGTLGDAGVFSFQSSKNLTAGEGGAAITNDDAMAEALYSMVNVGRRKGGGWYEHVRIGYNLRMTEFQAALLRTQLPRFAALQTELDEGARRLTGLLADVDGVVPDVEDPRWTTHGRHCYLMRLPGCTGDAAARDAVVAALQAEGLGASGGYVPLHRNTAVLERAREIAALLGRDYPDPVCPVADEVCTDTIWLHHVWLAGGAAATGQVAAALAKVLGRLDEVTAQLPDRLSA